MLLASLCRLHRAKPASATDTVPAYYGRKPVHWAAHITPDGKFLKWEALTDGAEVKPGRKPRAPVLTIPDVRRGTDSLPFAFCDTAEYAVGLVEPQRPGKAEKYHAAFIALMTLAAEQTGCPEAAAVVKALPRIPATPGAKHTERIVFVVVGKYLPDLPEIRAWWADRQKLRTNSDMSTDCTVCGKPGPIARVFTLQIKGIPKSKNQYSGLVTANTDNVDHYGKAQACGAAVCPACAATSYQALTGLLAADTCCMKLGPVAVVAWTAKGPWSHLKDALTTCNFAVKGPPTDVHILILSAHDARAVVNSYLVMPSTQVYANLVKWLGDQKGDPADDVFPLVGYRDADKWFHPGLLNQMNNTGKLETLSIDLVTRVVLSAITGSPMPRTRLATDELTPVSLALYRLCRAYRLATQKEDALIATPRNEIAYRTGRLLAVLERIQRVAIPNIDRTLADKYLRVAQRTPKRILGRLMSDAKAHLNKISRGRTGGRYEKDLNEAIFNLAIPDRLDTNDRADFVCGYFECSTSWLREIEERKKTEAADAEAEITDEEAVAV